MLQTKINHILEGESELEIFPSECSETDVARPLPMSILNK